MNELNPPRVQFGVTDRGGEYLNKLRALAAAVDTSMDGYNTMIAARNDAVSILADITVLAQQALADIEGVRTGGIGDLDAGRDSALAQMADIRTATVNQMNVLLGNADTQIGAALNDIVAGRDSALAQMNNMLENVGLPAGGFGNAAERNVGTTGDDLITAANALVNKGRSRITGAALDSARQAGAYGLSSSGPAGSYGFSTALTLQSAADRFSQLWIDALGGFKAFIRGGSNTSWQAWVELLTTHNLLQGLGQSTKYPVSQKAVTDAISSVPSVGVGQTWQDMHASRVSGTVYTNTTGKPIQLSLTSYQAGIRVYINEVLISRTDSVVTDRIHVSAHGITVPVGATYSVSLSSTSFAWFELR